MNIKMANRISKRISKRLLEYQTGLRLCFKWFYLHSKWCRTLSKVSSYHFEYVSHHFYPNKRISKWPTEYQNEYQKGYTNIKLCWNWASNDFIDTLNDAEHFLRSFLTTLGRFYITFATVSEYQNEYQNGYPNINLGWNCTSNDFIYTLDDAEYFVLAFPINLSRFYITFASITEYQKGYSNI